MINKKTTGFLTFLFICLLVFVLASCNDPGLVDGGSYLTINFGGGQGKAAASPPLDNILSHTEFAVTIKDPQGGVTTRSFTGQTSARVPVIAGTYTVTVEAFYKGVSYAKSNPVAAEVKAGSSDNYVEVPLKYDTKGIIIVPVNPVVMSGTEVQLSSLFDVIVFGGETPPSQTVTWTVKEYSGGDTNCNPVTGMLNIDPDEPNGTLTVIATADAHLEGPTSLIYTGTATTQLTVINVSPWIVTNTAEWNNALSLIRSGGSGTAPDPKEYTITIAAPGGAAGVIKVPGKTSASLCFGTGAYINVTLKGTGTLELETNGAILYVGANQKLTIDSGDLTLKGKNVNDNSVLIISGAGAELVLSDGTITGNSTSALGGGVYLDIGANFTMSGGAISGNTTSSDGGGVYFAGTAFTMTGGTIGGTFPSNKADNNGGGVFLNGGTFTLNGGTIKGNNCGEPANTKGGGVMVNGGTFEMISGSIEGNKANSGYGDGGGVYVVGGRTFTMRGGDIKGNGAGFGGGVYVASSGTFEMGGGTIYGETADGGNANGNHSLFVYYGGSAGYISPLGGILATIDNGSTGNFSNATLP